ncbi:MAG TPA: DNA-formamidopyrimidine glycosylase family protein [Fimbriimonadaceae bacterium]|nr:DNA-formamidopyrimidine glycosylase family protein [Fimbriimonadaceae bacterium]
MPELPEVETVRRLLQRALVGQKLVEVEVAPDEIVFEGAPPEAIVEALLGRTVTGAHRKGKAFWLAFDDAPWLFGHLGMAGWVRELGAGTIRLREHGEAPFEDEEGRPRFLKLRLVAENGAQIVLTDLRRLARVWLGESAESDEFVRGLGPDCLLEPATGKDLERRLAGRKAPIKALLLDQRLFAGVGNWIADEVLYHARIDPRRPAGTLTTGELRRLAEALSVIIQKAVDVGADSAQYPPEWLFHHRWGGGKGADTIGGRTLVREQVGGRTTAWVPGLQK